MSRRLRLSFIAWQRLLGRIEADTYPNWHSSLRYSLSGIAHSTLLRLQNASHAAALSTVRIFPPVFLLGFWRSGTTLLHELLCCDPKFGFPSTYACLNPSHFLLSESQVRARQESRTTRPMDNMLYSWASPQEDEFALLALGAPSPYEALIFPSLMKKTGELVDLRQRTREEQRYWTDALRSFLRLLTLQQSKPMVLKSPPHGFRLWLLQQMFPEAHYIVIERNPYEVFASNLKLWRTLLNLYALQPFSMEEVEDFVLQAYKYHEEAIKEGKEKLGPHQLATTRYEDLLAEPIREMDRLYSELDFSGFDVVRERMEAYLKSVSDYTRNRLVVTSAQKAHMETCWGPFLNQKGYSWPSNHVDVQT